MKGKKVDGREITWTNKNTKYIIVLHSCSRMELPKISMEGKWLEALGFQIGDRLRVEYGDRYIFIRHADNPGQPLAVHENGAGCIAETSAGENQCWQNLKSKEIKVASSIHVRQNSANRALGFYYPERSKISMEGRWLEKAGFHAGSRLQVDYSENAICIQPAV